MSTDRSARLPLSGSAPRHRIVALGAVAAVVAGVGGGLAVAGTTNDTPTGVVWDALPASYGIVSHGLDAVFSRTVLPSLTNAVQLGAAPAGQVLTVDLAIAHPRQAEENAMAEAIYAKDSPDFHHYLTPTSYAAMFGIPAATTQAAKDWATGNGLTVTSVSGAGDIVVTKGSVATLAKAFGVTFGSYRFNNQSFIANQSAPTVPTALHLQGIIGLNTAQQAVPDKADITTSGPQLAAEKAALAKAAAGGSSKPSPAVAGLTPDGPYTPQDMWSLYDLPDSNKGSGASAGIFMEGATAPLVSDLRLYEERAGLPQVPVRVVTEGTPGHQTDNLGADEWDLDTDAITGLAPDISSLSYYDAQSFFDADLLPDFANWRDDANGPLQMNASFGECEETPASSTVATLPTNNLAFGIGLGNNTEPMYETVLQAAAMMGKTLFASAGDTAASCPVYSLPGLGAANGLNDEGVPLANYPSASRWAVSVGGTDIEDNGDTPPTRALEYGEPTAGGGSSDFLAQQPWMTTAQGTNAQPCLTDEVGTMYPVGTLCRGMPDVSALYGGQVAAGYDTMTNHKLGSGGGTSLSSPLSVGMWTRIQAAAPTAAGLGFASPVLYQFGQNETTDTTPDFYDVTVGFNNNLASAGWDRDTGLGVIDGKNLMLDATGRDTPVRPAAQIPVPLPTTDACNPLFTTYSGNANDALDVTATQDPSIDITGGDIRDSSDGKSIIVTLTGPTLSPTLDSNLLPFGADDNMFFEVGKQLYYATASIAMVSGTVSYAAGTITGNIGDFAATAAGPDPVTGTFVTGTLTMTVPLTDIGSPTKGTRLAYPLALSDSAEIGPAFGAIGIDAGTDQDWIIGNTCVPGTNSTAGLTPATGATPGTLGFAKSAVPVTPAAPVVVTAPPAPIGAAPKPTSCTTVRTSTIKIYGSKTAKLNRHGQVLYTFKLFVNQGKCKTPSPVGRQFLVYVDGHKTAVLRTGKGGVQTYLVRLKTGTHTITAAFVGNKDLKKSASAKFRSHLV